MPLSPIDVFKKALPSNLFEYAAMDKPILAGLSGYSKKFVSSEVSNCAVFAPTDYQDAIKKLKSLELRSMSRETFKAKYKRDRIMAAMALAPIHCPTKIVSIKILSDMTNIPIDAGTACFINN